MLPLSPSLRLMIVEDDPDLLHLYLSELEDHIKHVDAFTNAEEAIRHYTQTQDYDLIVTDLKMPGRSGESLIVDVHLINPKQNIAIVSAHLDFLSLPKDFPVMKFCKPVTLVEVMQQYFLGEPCDQFVEG